MLQFGIDETFDSFSGYILDIISFAYYINTPLTFLAFDGEVALTL